MKLKEGFIPFVTSHFVKVDECSLRFINGLSGPVRIKASAEGIAIFVKVLALCDGFKTIGQIETELPDVPGIEVKESLSHLQWLGIVIDARNIDRLFRGWSELTAPGHYGPKHVGQNELVVPLRRRSPRKTSAKAHLIRLTRSESHTVTLANRRQSTRHFLPMPIAKQQLAGLLEKAYGQMIGHSILSAGAYYQLKVVIFLPRQIEDLATGWYEYSPEELALIRLDIPVGLERVCLIMQDRELVTSTSVIVFVIGNTNIVAQACGSRAYPLQLLETGAMLHGIDDFCVENSLGCLWLGGVNDERLRNLMRKQNGHDYLAGCIAIGVPDPNPAPTSLSWGEIAAKFAGALPSVWNRVFITPLNPLASKYEPCYEMASLQGFLPIGNNGENLPITNVGCGTSSDEAKVKAFSEGYERYACSIPRVTLIASENELKESYFDFLGTSPWTKEQCKLTGLVNREPDEPWSWIEGQRWGTRRKVFVPVDHCFFADALVQVQKHRTWLASTSGVASHFSVALAAMAATYELAERDAIMVAWYSQRELSLIPRHLYQDVIGQDSLGFWASHGCEVRFLDLTLDSCPVVMAVLHRAKYPRFSVGCAAAPTLLQACIKAWREAEPGMLGRMKSKPQHIRKADVVTTDDHLALYSSSTRYHHLLSPILQAKEREPRLYEYTGNLLDQWRPVIVNQTPVSPKCGLVVVRALSERLLPLNFGYGSECLSHPRLHSLGLKNVMTFPAVPHFFP